MRVLRVFPILLLLCLKSVAAATELKPETVAAYDRYIAALEQRFAPQIRGNLSIEYAAAETNARLRTGAILAWPGEEDGIIKVPDGLIHHWRAAVFVPNVTLESVLAVAQDYANFVQLYDWVIGSTLISHDVGRTSTNPRASDRFRVLLRIERSARLVTNVVDLWAVVEYHYPRKDRATSASHAEDIREVEKAGTANERRLPAGTGSGYLWRANTYAAYLQRDGGVYVDLQTVGLSRGFPPLLGWIIRPIARDLGRGSATESLRRLRQAVLKRRSDTPLSRDHRSRTVPRSAGDMAKPHGGSVEGFVRDGNGGRPPSVASGVRTVTRRTSGTSVPAGSPAPLALMQRATASSRPCGTRPMLT
jgi:hypothetical protein